MFFDELGVGGVRCQWVVGCLLDVEGFGEDVGFLKILNHLAFGLEGRAELEHTGETLEDLPA